MQQTPDLHPALNYTSPTDLMHIFLKAISLFSLPQKSIKSVFIIIFMPFF